MDINNFVLTSGPKGEIMAGGYIINSRLLVPSMTGGKNSEEDGELNTSQYAIPAGLYYNEIPLTSSSVEIIYKKYDVLPDDIYDNLYDNATYLNNENEEKKYKNRKNNTKKRGRQRNINNKKSRKQK